MTCVKNRRDEPRMIQQRSMGWECRDDGPDPGLASWDLLCRYRVPCSHYGIPCTYEPLTYRSGPTRVFNNFASAPIQIKQQHSQTNTKFRASRTIHINSRFKMQDARCKMQGARCKTQSNSNYNMQNSKYPNHPKYLLPKLFLQVSTTLQPHQTNIQNPLGLSQVL